jgi:hypothetical protein
MLRKQLASLGGRRAFSSSAPARRVVATGPVKAQQVNVRAGLLGLERRSCSREDSRVGLDVRQISAHRARVRRDCCVSLRIVFGREAVLM